MGFMCLFVEGAYLVKIIYCASCANCCLLYPSSGVARTYVFS
jgi:hypothetical protein